MNTLLTRTQFELAMEKGNKITDSEATVFFAPLTSLLDRMTSQCPPVRWHLESLTQGH